MMTLKDFGISSISVVQETAAAADIKSVPLVAGIVNNLVNRNQAIMKAEILSTLKTVTSHCSYKIKGHILNKENIYHLVYLHVKFIIHNQ